MEVIIMFDKEMSLKEQEILRSRLKERRLFLEMTYQELADKTGISKSTLQRYETGTIKNLAYDKILIISKALDVDPNYFINLSTDYTGDQIQDNTIIMENRADYLNHIKEFEYTALKFLTPSLISDGYMVEQRDRGSIGDLVAIRGSEVWHIDFMYIRDVSKHATGMGMSKQQLLLRFGRLAIYDKPISKYSIVVNRRLIAEQLLQIKPIHLDITMSIILLKNDGYEELFFNEVSSK
ncbi:helix-turn-helix domain-containing protein [Clostridium chromiireducens]|uniref:Helix-turn-helix domain-containing protein n=1 Tax=Clostridium chromiireducens TaxID=225345 RepID=A0A964RM55_9CLOT|nr:helix-turn-helix transcriptional regulator [Clostridium chromiireducens]MVX64258.1 helix-turn-helix domain-containing protein [Clostridium chromiireducens]